MRLRWVGMMLRLLPILPSRRTQPSAGLRPSGQETAAAAKVSSSKERKERQRLEGLLLDYKDKADTAGILVITAY